MPRPQPLIIHIMDEDDMRMQGCPGLCFKGEGYYWSYGDEDGIWDATPEGPFNTTIAAYADYAKGDSDE